MIFNLFKAKPTLKELIPKGFVDIHSHILPGIDDGAKNIEESLAMISEMKKLGFSKIIGTPHIYSGLYNNTYNSIFGSYTKIKEKVSNIQLSFASEYMLDGSIIEKANNKELICLNENFVLVEMSYFAPPQKLKEIIFEMKINDYTPVIAHPERYSYYFNDFNEFYWLKKSGCLFQINFNSLTGGYGKEVVKSSNLLLKKGLINFIGSDFHNIRNIQKLNRNDNKIKVDQIKKLEKIFENNEIFK